MKCSQCKTENLEPIELESGLVAAGCPSCEGVLLPLMNYRYWADNQPHVTSTDVESVEDSKGVKLCPKCDKMMLKFRLGANSENKIDLCGHCDEAWLDKGEWDLIKKLDLHATFPQIFTDAWQRNIRKEKEANSLKAHFEKLIGVDDFANAEKFKTWMDSHPQKADIKHYITTNFD